MTAETRRIFVLAGEVSGDHQAAHLVAALRRMRPGLEVVGAGGGRMAAAGAHVLLDTTGWGVIGYLEAYVRLPIFALRYLRLARLIERARPDLLLLVDFPGMNRELVRRFSGRLPIVYYVPPQTHGRRGRSAVRMAKAAVRLFTILPFEAEAYRRAGADVEYVGHPAVDDAPPPAGTSPLELHGCGPRVGPQDARASPPAGTSRLELHGGGPQVGPQDASASPPAETSRRDASASPASARSGADGPLVALLPGSRAQEIRALLPPMLAAARDLAIRHGARFVLPLASPRLEREVTALIAASRVPVRVVNGRAADTLAAADVAVLASGTAAVEAACARTPMVVVYRLSPLTAWIARRFVITGDLAGTGFSIPNIIAGRPIVPELFQDAVTGSAIRDAVERLLDPVEAANMRRDLAEVRRRLGPPGAVERAAAGVLRVLDSKAGAGIP